MLPFVAIFRQNGSPLSEEQRRQRSTETQPWAIKLNQEGHRLAAHILGDECHFSHENASLDNQGYCTTSSITALLFFEAMDFTQAISIAEQHPALKYGATIEVRPWHSPIKLP